MVDGNQEAANSIMIMFFQKKNFSRIMYDIAAETGLDWNESWASEQGCSSASFRFLGRGIRQALSTLTS